MKIELIAKIAKMEKGIASGAIPAASLPDVEKALENARKQLAKMEAEESPIKDVKAAGKPTPRADVYAWLSDAHPTLTRSSVDALASKEFDALHAKLVADVTQAFPANAADAADIAEQFLNAHLDAGSPKAEKAKPEPKPKAAKAAKAANPKSAKRNPQSGHTYDWMHKLGEGERTRAVRLPGRYYLHILEYDSSLTTRGVKVPLKKGDALLVNEQGYPMTFLLASQIDKQTAPWSETVTVATHDKAKERIEVLEGRITKVVAIGKAGKKAQTPDSGKPKTEDKPAPAKAASTDAPSPEPTKRKSWGREHGNVARLTESFYNFLNKHNWTEKAWEDRDILKVVYSTKGDKDYFYVQSKVYTLNFFKGNRIEWHKICPQSWKIGEKLKEEDYPKAGQYRLLLSESEIKKAKTTKGEAMYSSCLSTYRKFHECSKEGTCNPEDRKKVADAWHTCGDLTLKLEKLPEHMKGFHTEVKKVAESKGIPYRKAMSLVADSIN